MRCGVVERVMNGLVLQCEAMVVVDSRQGEIANKAMPRKFAEVLESFCVEVAEDGGDDVMWLHGCDEGAQGELAEPRWIRRA